MLNGAVGELSWHNPYAYANGNPTNLVDPTGMIAERPEWWDSCYQTDPCLPTPTSTEGAPPTNTKRPTTSPNQAPPTNAKRPTVTGTPCPSTVTPTPQATRADGTACPFRNGDFFNVFGRGVDQRPAILGDGDYLGEKDPTHAAVDLVPVGAFRRGDNKLANNQWAAGRPNIAQIYAVVNGSLWFYSDTGLLLENAADRGKHFQYEHVIYDPFRQPLPVCAGDHIGWVNSGANEEGSQDHLHFAYRNTRGVINATYYDPRPFFKPPLLRYSDEIRNYYTTTPTSNSDTPTPGPTYRPTPTPR